ncbi:MAG: glycosyltransferase family 4 protein [Lachnospiraceae bacterium]|nr:glycosyltransferase family 4 protein [Lachnospiraceae bacterium]
MRIAIDARSLSWENGKYTGVSTYLYEACVALSLYHPEHEYFVLAPRPFQTVHTFPDNWHFMTEGQISTRGKIWALLELPKIIKKENFDIYWGPNFTLPAIRRKRVKTAFFVTIYDLALWHFPKVGEKKNFFRVRMGTGKAVKKARTVLTISEYTKKDIVQILGVPEEKIHVAYPGGVGDQRSLVKQPLPDYVSNAPFFLFVSTIEPRKNILTIIQGFEKFKACGGDGKLVLAGKRGWNCEDIYEAVKHSLYQKDIIMPGYISAQEKQALYQHARGVLYPSLFEGFGIPVLEAFSYGVPVVTARNSSLPEVGGEAAFYIEDATDAQALAEKMETVCNLTAEAKSNLQEKMTMQVEKFTWKRTADALMAAWQEAQND